MKDVLTIFNQNKDVKKVLEEIKENKKVFVTNTSENHNVLLAASAFKDTSKNIFYVTSNVYKATKAYDMLSKVLNYNDLSLYLNNEVVATEIDAVNKEFLFERLNTIINIFNCNNKIIVTDIDSVLKELMPKEAIENSIINLNVGLEIERIDLINSLIQLGYRKVPTTSSVGFFSVRGEVIDIYPINAKNPIRIDFFDNEIEKIKYYDKDSQLSIKDSQIKEIKIYPYTELVYTNPEEIISKINKNINEYNFNKEMEDFRNYNYSERLRKYIHYVYNKTESILDYTSDKIIIFDDVNTLNESFIKTYAEMNTYYSEKDEYKNIDLARFFDFYYAFKYENIIMTNYFMNNIDDLKLKYESKIDLNAYSIPDFHNNIKLLLQELKTEEKYVLCFSSKENYNLMKEVLDSNKIIYSENDDDSKVKLCLSDNAISYGFYNGINVIEESNIYKKTKVRKSIYRSTYESTNLINSKEDLKIGDYIVHYNYGIGQYLGIKVIETSGLVNDYIHLKYSNAELYIPVENINMLEKFQGEEGYVPKLTNIGNDEWKKRKEKIKEKIESIARDLILLQAYRETKNGFKYEKDNEIQEMFENDFEFVETKDQLEIIKNIKRDMEEGKIIDHLVCGDVGYGKTEVAIRIAMKTILNGKQVVYLAPTTILSRQHYYTFKERMEKYGINVALFNRLVSTKNKKEIMNKLEKGNIDIVIGTHALLNDDMKYKDLGLLIVDEEQRFGVVHKEKIKQYKNNINVLTLTATPIPRTLQMSIVGTKQMSLMETPPANRYPVQTYVLEQNDSIIREAIYNELGRGGQVFYLHNRVEDIELTYKNLKRLVPEARIIIGHGQMTKIQLEDAIQSFIDKEYDILLCTTIIETGIDIPNTNTLIVENADHLGLAQMYQIRGRVGRTNRVSYAYFMYRKSSLLTQAGEQRLKALKEFTSLGSGYKIAIRDLAIRGAGDFLGKEQSGYIDALGMDLYMRLLSESMNELKGVKKEDEKEQVSYFEVSKHIDDSYVSDDDIKIYIHKTIAKIDSKEKRDSVIEELTDRFGKLNDDIILYINKRYIDTLIARLDISDVNETDFNVKIVFSKEISEKINAQSMMKAVYEMGEDFRLEYRNKRYYVYINRLIKKHRWIDEAIELFEKLLQIIS